MSAPTSAATTAPASLGAVLKNPAFRKLWLGQLVSIFGDFIAVYAVFSMVGFRMHGTPEQVTGILVAFLLPLAIVGPIAGVFVDHWNVKTTMIASDLIRAVLILSLVLAKTPVHVYVIFFALSTVSSFFIPAQSVALPLIVAPEALLSANAMMQQAVQLVRIVSPVAAGALVGVFGEQSCYYGDSLTFLFSAAMLATIAIPARPTPRERRVADIVKDLFSGMHFIFGHADLSFVFLSLTAGTFALSCFTALVAVYVRDILHGGSMLFGGLGSLIGVGTIVGSLFVRKLAVKRSRTHLVTAGIGGTGLFVLLMAIFNDIPATVAGCLGLGFSVAFILIPAFTLMQEETPPEMRGRVSSSSISLITFAQGTALLGSGALAAAFGIINLYLASAVMLMVIAAVGFWQLRSRG
jgi:MFS transporter, DHA3 family, macrolide efflux protein